MGEAKNRQKTGKPSALSRRRRRHRFISASLFGVVLIGIIGSVYWLSNPALSGPPSLPTGEDLSPFPEERDRVGVSIGNADAPVVVREFADFQCPACADFARHHDRLMNEYVETGKVRFVFFDMPLRKHRNAEPAAKAARCAEDQDAWRPMHDRLFAEQDDWSDASDPESIFTEYAGALGLDKRKFQRCMGLNRIEKKLTESRNLARDLRVTSTPTVLVDNIPLTRNSWAQLQAVLERELDEAQ
ncbi:thioredoxin domain-containing protein [Salicola sp. Rm-C-2C1-2]|uniref:DsbA family protein n=1 Tax=Salicola sp. Rm-C-2C1-2 TaxID=3141321 RepID=UPI0032E40A8E